MYIFTYVCTYACEIACVCVCVCLCGDVSEKGMVAMLRLELGLQEVFCVWLFMPWDKVAWLADMAHHEMGYSVNTETQPVKILLSISQK